MADEYFASISKLRNEMSAGRITSTELVNMVFERIKRYNTDLNAIVTMDEKEALKQAEIADNEFKSGKSSGPLHGIPVTVKDFFKTAGMRTTAGILRNRDNIPDVDATVVGRLRKAGAIVIGKTNMPALAMDCQTDNQIFGRTNNPWDLNRTPGGSSGGGAAAVASGMSFLDVGNDLLGSIRIPSHFCGVFSIVPTEKLVPNTGLLMDKPNHGTLGRMMRTGVMGRSPEDLKTVLEIISGPDNEEADCISLKRFARREYGVQKLKLAWTADAGLNVSENTAFILENMAKRISGQGHEVRHLHTEEFDFQSSREVFLRIFYPVLGANMPLMICLAARYLCKAGYLDMNLKKYLDAENTRAKLISQLDSIFDTCDALVCPVTATPAFPHMKPDGYNGMSPVYKKGININGRVINYAEANMGFTVPFSVTGNPVVVMPAGLSGEGLPVGAQLIGRRYDDLKLLEIASGLKDIVGSIGYPPLYR